MSYSPVTLSSIKKKINDGGYNSVQNAWRGIAKSNLSKRDKQSAITHANKVLKSTAGKNARPKPCTSTDEFLARLHSGYYTNPGSTAGAINGLKVSDDKKKELREAASSFFESPQGKQLAKDFYSRVLDARRRNGTKHAGKKHKPAKKHAGEEYKLVKKQGRRHPLSRIIDLLLREKPLMREMLPLLNDFAELGVTLTEIIELLEEAA